MALFPVSPNPRSSAILENSNGDISAADHPITPCWFKDGVFGVGVSNGVISGFTKVNRYVGKTTCDE